MLGLLHGVAVVAVVAADQLGQLALVEPVLYDLRKKYMFVTIFLKLKRIIIHEGFMPPLAYRVSR